MERIQACLQAKQAKNSKQALLLMVLCHSYWTAWGFLMPSMSLKYTPKISGTINPS
ncbi:hypothetical protein N431DRAFT_426273, partial [Stipitochalara longipes BDJ]